MQKGTIIIAAVVSMSSSGLISSETTAPSMAAQTTFSLSNGLTMDVLSVSEAINSDDLGITLQATANNTMFRSNAENGATGSGAGVKAGKGSMGDFVLMSGVVIKNSNPDFVDLTNFKTYDAAVSEDWGYIKANAFNATAAPNATQLQGVKDHPGDSNYSVLEWTGDLGTDGGNAGQLYGSFTKLHRLSSDHEYYYYMVDLNKGWSYVKSKGTFSEGTADDLYKNLKIGDTINVQVLHTPSNKIIYNADVRVVS